MYLSLHLIRRKSQVKTQHKRLFLVFTEFKNGVQVISYVCGNFGFLEGFLSEFLKDRLVWEFILHFPDYFQE